MRELPLRRGQLVTTFGPGALVISPEGETAIIGSLDKWYYDKNGYRIENLDEYEIHEPRLRSLLKVKRLLLPPDYRSSFQYKGEGNSSAPQNPDIYIPMLRFPTWHYCPKCYTLHQAPMSSRSSVLDCKECKKPKRMVQVPFVIVCKDGHISDFPWREWAHSDENCNCEHLMKLISTGGATLESMKVKCECGKERSLKGIMSRKTTNTDEGTELSYLSTELNEGDKLYKCPGHKPWYGSEDKCQCSNSPIVSLKNSINVYMPETISAIHLPGEHTAEVEEIIDLFEQQHITSSFIGNFEKMDMKIKMCRNFLPPEAIKYSDSEIELAILYVEGTIKHDASAEDANAKNAEMALRKKEFDTLVSEVDTKSLKVRKEWDINQKCAYDVSSYFQLLNRVTKLKETIALIGFKRLVSNETSSSKSYVTKGKELLFKDPSILENDWLPAYKVYGEGIFFTLRMDVLNEWEQKLEVCSYMNKMYTRLEKRGVVLDLSLVNAKSIMLHTLAHLIIDELSLTCGYNTASIRERLYLPEDQGGVLIYTSSGDIDGTFGGLVRMGKTKNFFPVVTRALEKAKWCSSDPVCSEIGKSSGQGYNNLNGAACHNCTYLPETSCELKNLYLDRTLLIDPEIGFFKNV